MHPRLALLPTAAVIVAATVPALAGGATRSVTDRGVTAVVTERAARISDGRVTREWALHEDGTVTTEHLLGAGRRDWAATGPDFSLDLLGVPTSSTQGWRLTGAAAQRAAGGGAQLEFRYALADPALPTGVELRRTVTLRPGSAVLQTASTLVNGSPAALRTAAYSLDEITARDLSAPAEVQAYNDGSDWRDDYRHVSRPPGAFDTEGEVARFGRDAGWFLVSERRGGVMSRAGRDASGRTWVGVDWARDAFDWGPLRTDPPTYNRQDNPAYPVPVRARLVPPLSALSLGTAFTGVYDGGADEAARSFVDVFDRWVTPQSDRTVGANSFHPWNHGPLFSDLPTTDPPFNISRQVDAAAALGIEQYMLDDQWQGGPGGESGDWQFDAARFPDTDGNHVPDVVDHIHARGMRLGLWMSPLEFNSSSRAYAAHPDWACAPIGHVTAQVPDDAGLGVWDATNPVFQDYLVGVVDRLVRDFDVTEFKFDFMAWVDCAPHDYADYEDAFVATVRRMEQRHPGVTFELDETNDQRSWPFESAALGPSWFDNAHDHGSGPVPKLLHDLWSAAPWLATSSIGMGAYDGTLKPPFTSDFLMPLALLSHPTFWTDLTKLTPEQQAATTWWTTWFRDHRASLDRFSYELTTADPLDGTSPLVLQPWDGRAGYVFAFRQAGTDDTATVALRGVDPATSYALTDVRTGTSYAVRTGAELSRGLTLDLATPWSALVLAVQPISS